MKFRPLAVVFFTVSAASLFIFLVRLSSSGDADAHFSQQADGIIATSIRKLRETSFEEKSHSHAEDVGVEDYGRIDPSPSSKAMKHGPIEHGTPLNPFLPRLPPPSPSPSSPQFDD